MSSVLTSRPLNQTDERDVDSRKSPRNFLIVGIVASVLILIIAATARMPTYRVAPLFLIPILWLPCVFRRALGLTPALFALFASAMVFHDLGAYGYYQVNPWFLPWRPFDNYVHFWFGVVGTLILRRALEHHFGAFVKPWQLNVTTLLFVMGMGALHEIMEYMSYLILGEGKSMLRPSVMYFFDTQRDLTNNLLGATTALVGRWIVERAGRANNTHGFDVIAKTEVPP